MGRVTPSATRAGLEGYPQGADGQVDRSKLPDSFKYYGPNGLWWKWTEDQKKYGHTHGFSIRVGPNSFTVSSLGSQGSTVSRSIFTGCLRPIPRLGSTRSA